MTSFKTFLDKLGRLLKGKNLAREKAKLKGNQLAREAQYLKENQQKIV